jgi:hypothetical protein
MVVPNSAIVNSASVYPLLSKMGLHSFKYSIVCIYVILQFITPASDTLGGLSGNDSIVRASIASLDAPSGLLFTWATMNYLMNIPTGRLYLPRFGLLHSLNREDSLGKELRLSARLSWTSFFSTSTRIAQLFRVEVMSNDSGMQFN